MFLHSTEKQIKRFLYHLELLLIYLRGIVSIILRKLVTYIFIDIFTFTKRLPGRTKKYSERWR